MPDEFKIPLWYENGSVHAGLGYKDNVLLSSSTSRGSGFWSAGADMMVYRLPSGGWQFHGLASFDNIGYLDKSIGVGNEQSGVGMAQVTKSLGHDWKMGLGGNYLYQNQVFDASVTETNQYTNTQVLGHNLTGRWFVRKDFKPYWIEAEASVSRQWLATPLDSFWQTGPRLTLGRSYGHGSDVALTYQWSHLAFDTREQFTAEGDPETDTHLRFHGQVVEAAWHHVWDKEKHWHTVTKLGLDINQDTGSGYFDFMQYRLMEQIKYRGKTWEVSAYFRAGYYDFSVQTVSATDLALRRKTMLSAGLRGEKNLSKSFKVYASCTYDDSLSNVSYDRYQSRLVSGGVEYHF